MLSSEIQSKAALFSLNTDFSWVSIEHHESKFLWADAAEEDVKRMVGGYDAVE